MGGPPQGATLVTENPAPTILAPKQIEGQPPKGATLVKSSSPVTQSEQAVHIPPPKQEGVVNKVLRGGALGAFEGAGIKPATTSSEVLTGTAKQAGKGIKNLVGETWESNRFSEQIGGLPARVAATAIDLVPTLLDKTATSLEQGAKSAYKDIQNKDWESAAEHIVSTVTQAALLRGAGKVQAGKLGELMDNSPIAAKDAARTLTDAVNPHPQAMEGFESTLHEQMPRIVDYAKRSKLDIKSRSSLAKAVEGAGDEAYRDYYSQYIEPTKDVRVPTNDIPGYKGTEIDYNTTTIAGLEKRLSTINATLYPKFQKGGVAAEAAISAESAASLNAEAAAIRQAMNDTIGKKLGIEPSEIANKRSTFGSLRDVADKTVRAINEERFGQNLERRGADVPTDRASLGRYVIRKLTGRNPDKSVASTVKRLQLEPPAEATKSLPPQPAPFPRKPVTQGMEGTQTEIGTTRTPESEIAVHQQRMADRIKQVKQQAEARQQQHMKARELMQTRVKALKEASDKLGPRASTKEIIAEADKSQGQQ